MFLKLHDRLLTRYPLLWNTKLVWIASSLITLHILFFLSGFAAINAGDFKSHYSLMSILSAGLLTFSILCSLVVIIFWLVYYLRNNAYKSFFIIDKYYLPKEFLIILLVIVFSITFFESYKWGGWLKTRTITNKQQLVKEANTVNLAMAFIPRSKSDFFKLVSCDEKDPGRIITYQENYNYFDTASYNYNDSDNVGFLYQLLFIGDRSRFQPASPFI